MNLQTVSVPDIRADMERDGYVVLRGLLSPEETARCIAAGAAAAELPHEDRFALFYQQKMPAIADGLYAFPVLVGLVRQLLGDDIALYYQRYVLKDRFYSGAADLHQDVAYYHGTQDKYHVFLPLTHVDATNGGMSFWKGTHKFGLIGHGHMKTERFPGYENGPVVELDPGDVVIMHNCTWHESPEVSGDVPRYLYQAIYQPASDGAFYDEPHLVHGDWRTDLRVSKDDANMLTTLIDLLGKVQAITKENRGLYEEIDRLRALVPPSADTAS